MRLVDKLGQADATRQRVLDDCVTLLDAEVDSKGGLSGMAIKGAYGLLKKFKPGMARKAIDHFLDDFMAALEPMYAAFQSGGAGDFKGYLVARQGEVAQALLTVTDAKAAAADASARALKGAYSKLRPIAAKHVEAAVPGLAAVIVKYV